MNSSLLKSFFPLFAFMCEESNPTDLKHTVQHSASYKLILTQALNKRNTVALPSRADATPSLAHAEYSSLIVARRWRAEKAPCLVAEQR